MRLQIAVLFLCAATCASAQWITYRDPATPRTKDGKKLLTAMDLMRINGVSAPRISPDGSRVAYTVSEVKMEKDKEWKNVSQIWVVPASGNARSRQYTRGDKNATSPEWSPDGTMLAFLSDREKDGERQVWMMMADGGEVHSVDRPQARCITQSLRDEPRRSFYSSAADQFEVGRQRSSMVARRHTDHLHNSADTESR